MITTQNNINLTNIYSKFKQEVADCIFLSFGYLKKFSCNEIIEGIYNNNNLVARGLIHVMNEISSNIQHNTDFLNFIDYYQKLIYAIKTGDRLFKLYVEKLRIEEVDVALGNLYDTSKYLPYSLSLIPQGYKRIYFARDGSSYFECELILDFNNNDTQNLIIYVSRFFLGTVYDWFIKTRNKLLTQKKLFVNIQGDGNLFTDQLYKLFCSEYFNNNDFKNKILHLNKIIIDSIGKDSLINGNILWCDIGFFGTIPIILQFMFKLLHGVDSEVFSAESYIEIKHNFLLLKNNRKTLETGFNQIKLNQLVSIYGFDKSEAVNIKHCTSATCGADYPQPIRYSGNKELDINFSEESPKVLLGSYLRSILIYNGACTYLEEA